MSRSRLDGIQALRAAAAYAVVVFHVFEFLHLATGGALPKLIIGAAGVDLFFVISGFVMVYVTSERETAMTFSLKRLARIVPLYWAATLAALLFAALVPWTFAAADLSAASIAASFLFIPMQDLAGKFEPILFVGWTLNYEMAFYLLFALSLLLPARLRAAALSAAIIGGMYLARQFEGTPLAFYGHPIVLEFLAGCMIGWALRSRVASRIARHLPVWPLVALALAGYAAASFAPEAYSQRHVYFGIPAVLLVLAVAAKDLHRKPFESPMLRWAGDASYSAYLLHPFVLMVAAWATQKLAGSPLTAAIFMTSTTVVLTLILSRLSFRLLEMPVNHWFRANMERPALRGSEQEDLNQRTD